MKAVIFGQWETTDVLRQKLVSYGFSVIKSQKRMDLSDAFLIALPYTDQSFVKATELLDQFPHCHFMLVGNGIASSDEDAFKVLLGFNPPQLLTVGEKIERPLPIQKIKKTKQKKSPVIKAHLPHSQVPFTALSFAVLIIVVALFLPFVLLATSLGTSAASVFLSKKNLTTPSTSLLKFSSTTASWSQSMFEGYSLLSPTMRYFAQIAKLTHDGSFVLGQFYQTEATGKLLANALLSRNSTTQVSSLTKNLSHILSDLYRDTSFWTVNSQSVLSAVAITQLAEVTTYLRLIPTITPLLQNASLLSGEEKPTTYLILLQNNMELRPTGGFIGSFALFTVERGKIMSREVYDVYDADGHLAGFVNPPEPIKKYLKEASWHMRDSNWDPDFPISAKRALWFLDKTMNRNADVVVGVDLNFVKALLKVTGPVEVTGYNEQVDAETLYEKAQSHAEKDFFPGSTAKKTYLAALTESVLSRIQEGDSATQKQVLLSLVNQFENRSIQMWSGNETLQQAFHSIGWDGGYEAQECGAGCVPVLSSIVEANLGVNKANQSISRSVASSWKKEGDTLTITTAVTLSHDGKYRHDGNEAYRSYIRDIAPIGAQFKNVRVVNGGDLTVLAAEVKETNEYSSGGIFVVVQPNSTVTVSFSYELTLPEGSSALQFQWIKQSGVDPYALTLTDSLGHVYNTSLRARYTLDTPIK